MAPEPQPVQETAPVVPPAAAPTPLPSEPTAAGPSTPFAAAVPALPPAPRNLPASAVQYLEPPVPEYPRASRRLGESGRVTVRVLIDEAGVPRTVQLARSSGHSRLDEAALQAVQKARFKPYVDNGLPTAGWALIPLVFDLEQ